MPTCNGQRDSRISPCCPMFRRAEPIGRASATLTRSESRWFVRRRWQYVAEMYLAARGTNTNLVPRLVGVNAEQALSCDDIR